MQYHYIINASATTYIPNIYKILNIFIFLIFLLYIGTLVTNRQKISNKSYFRQKDGSQVLKVIDCDRETKDAENVWTVCPTKAKDARNHPAVFPEQLASDHIISWSNEGDLVYDPFMGSGTTARMAILNKRNWIGSEISEEYCEITEKRIQVHNPCQSLFLFK